ncbi:MAG TPA: hypothetical protein VFN42_03420 [Acetobacteraceae bacterium]|nr:hypothetical protein [Acetobacteraceae bacterium]
MSLSHLCLSLLALTPELSASLLSGLLAAVPVIPGAATPEQRKALLIQQMNEMQPRDLEEAMLASQFLAAWHQANACFDALEGLDPVSKEASRLRRDGLAMQRSAIATQRALHRSRTRPMLQDADGGEPRPTVPVRLANPPRGRAAGQENPPVAAMPAPANRPTAAGFPVAQAVAEAYAKDPSLARLAQNWDTLKRWEDMTMEERRETFGYKYEPKSPGGSNGIAANPSANAEAARSPA